MKSVTTYICLHFLENVPSLVPGLFNKLSNAPLIYYETNDFSLESLDFLANFNVELFTYIPKGRRAPITQPVRGDFLSSLTYAKDVFVRIVSGFVLLATHPEEFSRTGVQLIAYDFIYFDKKSDWYDLNLAEKQTSFFFLIFILFFLFGYFFIFIQESLLRVCLFNNKYVQIWKHNLKLLNCFLSKNVFLVKLKKNINKSFFFYI